jgi:hypothetical protein
MRIPNLRGRQPHLRRPSLPLFLQRRVLRRCGSDGLLHAVPQSQRSTAHSVHSKNEEGRLLRVTLVAFCSYAMEGARKASQGNLVKVVRGLHAAGLLSLEALEWFVGLGMVADDVMCFERATKLEMWLMERGCAIENALNIADALWDEVNPPRPSSGLEYGRLGLGLQFVEPTSPRDRNNRQHADCSVVVVDTVPFPLDQRTLRRMKETEFSVVAQN